ncbi:hypothetical protein TNCV_4398271 [Trichonephila clavipes]|nr:hypothetical protein TNCV_4398271 [Trichonephila clavipes]
MTSAGTGDQPVNKKDSTQGTTESLFNNCGTKENGVVLTLEKLLTLIDEVKSVKTAEKKVPCDYWLLQHFGVSLKFKE